MTKLPKGIYEKDGKFVASPTFNGRRKSRVCDTLEEAIAARQELLGELRSGADIAKGAISTKKDWSLQYALDVAKSTPPGATRATGGWRGLASMEKQVFNAQAALDYFGPQTLLKDLDFTALSNYVNYLASDAVGNSGSTINRKLAALSKLFAVAELHGVIDKRPKFPRQQEGDARDRVVSQEEEAVLLHYAEQFKKDDFRDALIVLLDTGLRVGELRKLRPCHVDVRNNQLALSADITKSKQSREVPLTPRAREVVLRRKLGAAPKERLWPVTYQQLRQTWDYIKRLMGLAEDRTFVIHACRHTCASRLAAAGVPLPGVQDFLGHANITTTMRYVKYAPSLLHGAAEALNKYNAEEQGTKSPEMQSVASDADLG